MAHSLEKLRRRHAEILAEIAGCEASLAELHEELKDVEARLRLFGTEFGHKVPEPAVRTTPRPLTQRVEMSRLVLAILQEAGEPPSTREIAALLVVPRDLKNDLRVLNLTTRRVERLLRAKLAAGLVRTVEGVGPWSRWELVDKLRGR